MIVFTLIISILLSACAAVESGASNAPTYGQVFELQLQSTLWGMQQAAKGASGTSIFQKDNLITFLWTLKDGWAFVTIDISSSNPVKQFIDLSGRGNFVNPRSMSDIVRGMTESGWRVIPASQLPEVVVTALQPGSSLLGLAAGGTTSLLVVPADILMTPPILREYQEATIGIDG